MIKRVDNVRNIKQYTRYKQKQFDFNFLAFLTVWQGAQNEYFSWNRVLFKTTRDLPTCGIWSVVNHGGMWDFRRFWRGVGHPTPRPPRVGISLKTTFWQLSETDRNSSIQKCKRPIKTITLWASIWALIDKNPSGISKVTIYELFSGRKCRKTTFKVQSVLTQLKLIFQLNSLK